MQQESAMSVSQHWSEWPRRNRSFDPDGYLYVLEFSMGVVKVGKTHNPRGRVIAHSRDVARFDATLTRWWLSELHREYHANERTLIDAGARIGRPLGSGEYLADASYDALVALAERLPMSASTVKQRGEVKAKPHVQQRRQRVAELRDMGNTIPEIVSQVGASLGTVWLDLQALGYTDHRQPGLSDLKPVESPMHVWPCSAALEPARACTCGVGQLVGR
jgi:hypothetical protein